jgi:hypothetical protein
MGAIGDQCASVDAGAHRSRQWGGGGGIVHTGPFEGVPRAIGVVVNVTVL